MQHSGKTPEGDAVPTYDVMALHHLTSISRRFSGHEEKNSINPQKLVLREHFLACFSTAQQVNEFLTTGTLPPDIRKKFSSATGQNPVTQIARELRGAQTSTLPATPSGILPADDPFAGLENITHSGGYVGRAVPFQLKNNFGNNQPYIFNFASSVVRNEGEPYERGFAVFTLPPGSPEWSANLATRIVTQALNTSPIMSATTETRLFLHNMPETSKKESLLYLGRKTIDPESDETIDEDICKPVTHMPAFIGHGLLKVLDETSSVSGDFFTANRNKMAAYLISQFNLGGVTNDRSMQEEMDRNHLHHTLRRMRQMTTHPTQVIDPELH